MMLLVFVLIFYLTLGLSNANLNLYMDVKEAKRILGVDGELFYVRNGIINNYALSFTVPIKPDVNEIFFTWQNLHKSPSKHRMLYWMSITTSNHRAMSTPFPNIQWDGQVPTKLSVFKITLPCTGMMSTEVDIRIHLNITIFSAANLTTLDIKRRKTCLLDDRQTQGDQNHRIEGGKPRGDNNRMIGDKQRINNTYIVTNSLKNKVTTTSTKIFYIAVGCACGAILLIAAAVAIYYIRLQKSQNDRYSETSSSRALTQEKTYLRADTPNNSSVSGMPGMRRAVSPVSMIEIKPGDVRPILAEIQIDRNRISLGDVIMEGTFGRIYHGTLYGEDENDVDALHEIYVKTVTEQTRPDQVDVMLRECCIMKGLCHPNINAVLATCLDIDTQPLLVYLFMNEGNLKKFLQRCKLSEVGSHQVLNTQHLVYMATQIVRGLQYLHRKRIVHKDVASRNCIVDSNLVVKVTENALSRDFFPNDYHCLGDNENRPVKWLALEALLDRRFSPASDVWAFGVTLWELMTLGQQPYADIDPFEMASYLKDGYRISQPMNCPDELFAVMACCWSSLPEERPKMSQLLICLQDFYAALRRFI